jgi:SAM-dependent methyltransferase
VPDWFTDPSFWEEMFDFIFPPEHLALGEEIAAHAAEVAAVRPPARLLDLGCGPGRVAVPLARRGFRVVGVDAIAGYLAHARAAAAAAGVAIDLRHGDVAEVTFDAEFDAVLCLFTSFGYFADPAKDAAVLRAASRALVRGGRFVLETAHRDGVVRKHGVREMERPDGRRFREDQRFDPVTGVLHARWTVRYPGPAPRGDPVAASPRGVPLTPPGGAPAPRERTYETRMRPYTATELDAMLRAAGFREVRFQRDLWGGEPSLDAYEIVAVAVR